MAIAQGTQEEKWLLKHGYPGYQSLDNKMERGSGTQGKAWCMKETELFISVFEAERSLWDVKSKIYKDHDFGVHSQELFVVFFFKPKFLQ